MIEAYAFLIRGLRGEVAAARECYATDRRYQQPA
jgi:hypothetical protein